jgi:hypothetical protein
MFCDAFPGSGVMLLQLLAEHVEYNMFKTQQVTIVMLLLLQ